MFSLFPVHRPRIGVSIRARALDLVEVRRRWGRPPIVRRFITRPLPDGLVAPSATALNITDGEAFAKELNALCEPVRDRTVAVDLPMACGTLGLFHFETFPPSPAEQDALLRWRFRQSEHLGATDLHVVSRSFRSSPPSTGPGPVAVLAVAIKQGVLAQYREACEAADLLPVSMGFSTLHLIDFYRPTMPKSDESFFAHRTAEALIVLAFRQGQPAFLRVKPLRRTDVDLERELLLTLRCFDSEFPHAAAETVTAPLYIVEERVAPLPAAQMASPPEVWTPTENSAWTITVTRAHWNTAPVVTRVPAPEHLPFGALAGVVAS
jgi:hypothetical protein